MIYLAIMANIAPNEYIKFFLLNLLVLQQKEKIRRNSKISIVNRKMVYMYNVKEKYYITAISVSVASTITGLSRSNIGRVANKTYTKNNIKYFLCSFSKEDLQD